jgi:hypothetical protein
MTIHEGCRVTVTDLISALAAGTSIPRVLEAHALPAGLRILSVFIPPGNEAWERLFCTGICLPSGTALTDGDLERIPP